MLLKIWNILRIRERLTCPRNSQLNPEHPTEKLNTKNKQTPQTITKKIHSSNTACAKKRRFPWDKVPESGNQEGPFTGCIGNVRPLAVQRFYRVHSQQPTGAVFGQIHLNYRDPYLSSSRIASIILHIQSQHPASSFRLCSTSAVLGLPSPCPSSSLHAI